MATLTSWFKPFKELPADFGVSKPGGTSLTIPGQGSDLALIIQSIVKLPPIDERDYDVGTSQEIDITRLDMTAELSSLYPAEAHNEALAAQERQLSRKAAKESADEEKDEESIDADADAE